MKVILLKTVPKLGKKDDIVEVSEGYAANALFPKRLAIVATPAAVDALATRKQQKVAEKDIQDNLLERFIETLIENPISINVKTNKQGGLFSSIDERGIAKELLAKYNMKIDPKMLEIESGVIKQAGTFVVRVKGYNSFSVEVVAVK